MNITAENFSSNPNMYFGNAIAQNNIIRVATKHGEAVVLSANEYERQRDIIETLAEFDEADKQFEAGEYFSHTEVCNHIEAMLGGK